MNMNMKARTRKEKAFVTNWLDVAGPKEIRLLGVQKFNEQEAVKAW